VLKLIGDVKDFIIYSFLKNQFIQFILTGGGIIGVLKVLLLLNGWRLYSFIRVYKNKTRFLDHSIFKKINFLLKSDTVNYTIQNLAKKELANDIMKIELYRIKLILKNNLKHIFKSTLKEYILNYTNFNARYITNLFIDEYFEYKEHQKQFARNKMTKNDYMSQEDFNKFWTLYIEYSRTYEIIIYESLNIYPNKKNIYGILWAILDHFEILVEIISKTTSHKLNIMNGRATGIKYKGYEIK
jgi:hypothetical protein